MIYYFVEQRGGRSASMWDVYGLSFEIRLSEARAYRRQIIREKLAAEVRIVRVDTKTMTIKVVK